MKQFLTCTGALGVVAGAALAGNGANVDSVRVNERIFNDRPDSALTITNNFPASVQIDESGFGPGGFANRHSAYLSNDGGASNLDFNYEDAWDVSVRVTHLASTNVTVEAGIHSDLFGLGFFGQLPNGEIASFGSVLPFHTFGVHPFAQSIMLRIIHSPGTGDGVNPLPMGGTASTIEYQYDIGGGWISSGPIAWGTTEGGLPTNFNFFLGFGAQHNAATETGAFASTLFDNITVGIPAPGAAGLICVAGLVGLRRRR